MDVYRRLAGEVPQPVARDTAVAYLCAELPYLWASEYPATGGELVTVRQGGKKSNKPATKSKSLNGTESTRAIEPLTVGAVDTLFDLHVHTKNNRRTGPPGDDDRVVAVWGLSRTEPADTRDRGRMGGFLKGVWSDAYPGRDRGHFFAHTMGGGTDINLFPQLSTVNRGGEWRQLEIFAAAHPGTFCFIRPFYAGSGWTPTALEYGIFKMPPKGACTFWGNLFPN